MPFFWQRKSSDNQSSGSGQASSSGSQRAPSQSELRAALKAAERDPSKIGEARWMIQNMNLSNRERAKAYERLSAADPELNPRAAGQCTQALLDKDFFLPCR